MKRIVLLFAVVINYYLVFSQGVANGASDNIDTGGDWTANSIWVDNSSPGLTGLQYIVSNPTTPNAKGKFEVVADGSLSYANVNGGKLYVNSGTLIVQGSVTFAASKNNADLRVAAGATLIILGSLSMGTNNADGDIGGVLVVTGAISSSGNTADFVGSGNIYASSYSANISPNTGNNTEGISSLDSLLADDNPTGIDLEAISDYINNNGTVPLPVKLLSFDLEVNNGVTVTWSTVSEKDNDYFIVERSEDGRSFYPIAEIDGNGTTQTLNTYEFTDYSPQANVSFYRLLQVDYDGAFEYFPAKRIEISENTAINIVDIYPTLVTQGKANLVGEYPLYIENAYLYDLRGGKVDNVKNNLASEGIFRYSLDVSDLTNGVYILKFIDTKGDSFTKKFVVEN